MHLSNQTSTNGIASPTQSAYFGGQRNKRPRLGQLLVGAGMVETETLHTCLRVARRTHQKLGAILVEKRVITGEQLHSALLAQQFIADGVVAESVSASLLQAASAHHVDLPTVISSGLVEDINEVSNIPELSQLLMGSGMVKAEMLGEIEKLSVTAGISFGKALLLSNTLSTENLDAILITIALIRTGNLSLSDAIKAIRDLRYNRIEINRQNLRFDSKKKNHTHLGEMLVESQCLSDFECLVAIENALASKQHLGQMLIQTGLVSQTVIENALLLQKFATLGAVADDLAAACLRKIEHEGLSLSEAARQLKLFKDTAHATAAIEILMEGGYVTSQMVQDAIVAQAAFEMDPAKALLASAMIAPSLMACAKTCAQHVESGEITLAQALELIADVDKNCFTAPATCVVKKAVSQQQANAALAKNTRANSNPINKLQNEVRGFNTYPEFRILISLMVFMAVAAYAVMHYVPSQFNSSCLIGLGAMAAVVLMLIGRSWTNRSDKQELAESVRMESAQHTIERLQKRYR